LKGIFAGKFSANTLVDLETLQDKTQRLNYAIIMLNDARSIEVDEIRYSSRVGARNC